MQNTKEHIQVITVKDGDNTNEVVFKPEAGKIIGCVAYVKDDSDLGNSDFVNLSLQDHDGQYLSKMQDVRNYRSRDAKYSEGCKPLNVEGGNNMTLRVASKQPFSKDFTLQFILVYENERNNCDLGY